MKTNYAPYLTVQSNGAIWWQIDDAEKLVAGYLPVCSDSKPEVVLQAPSNSAVAHHRGLISAVHRDIPNVVKPRLITRDGKVYVEASEFLGWFSQYLGHTQSGIPFPSELARLVHEAAKSSTDNTGKGFRSLLAELDGWFERPLADLPEVIAQRVRSDLFPLPWDAMSPEQREMAAQQWDCQHDPETESDRQQWWDLFAEMDAIQRKIDEWEAIPAPTASDLATKEAKLAELHQNLTGLTNQERQMLEGDTPITVPTDETFTPAAGGQLIGKAKRPLISDCLTTPPARQDSWYEVIGAMVTEFINENGRCPSVTEAWSRLYNRPPRGYDVETCLDRGDNSLKMNDTTLSRRAFAVRWSRYTHNKTQ